MTNILLRLQISILIAVFFVLCASGQSIVRLEDRLQWDSIYTISTQSQSELLAGLVSNGWKVDNRTDSTLFIFKEFTLYEALCRPEMSWIPNMAKQPTEIRISVDWRPNKYRAKLISGLIYNESGALMGSMISGVTVNARDNSLAQLDLFEETDGGDSGSKHKRAKYKTWLGCLGRLIGESLVVKDIESDDCYEDS